MNRGLCSAESTKVEPSPSRRLKSGAGSPVGVVGGASVVTVVWLDVVATVVPVEAGAVTEVVVASSVVAVGLPPQAATSVRVSATAVLRMLSSVKKPAA
jgi:hypothetical protein